MTSLLSMLSAGALAASWWAVPTVAAAQTDYQSGAAQQRSVRELIEISGSAALGAQIADQMLQAPRPLLALTLQNVPLDIVDERFDQLRLEFEHVVVVAPLGPIYRHHFTPTKIEDLLTLSNTQLVQRTIELMPIVVQETIVSGQESGKSAGQHAEIAISQSLEV